MVVCGLCDETIEGIGPKIVFGYYRSGFEIYF